jgi:hypothetical protein
MHWHMRLLHIGQTGREIMEFYEKELVGSKQEG